MWQPGAGGMCLHTIVLDPRNTGRIVAIRQRAPSRSDDGGETWLPINRGLRSDYELPDPMYRRRSLRAQRVAMHLAASRRPLHAEALGRHAQSDDAGAMWHEVSGNLPSDFGFPIACVQARAGIIYVAHQERLRHYPPDGKLRVTAAARAATSGALTEGLPAEQLLRQCCAAPWPSTRLDACGVYFGTTGAKVYASADWRHMDGHRP